MKWSREKSLTVFYFALYLVAALTIALHQPLNDTYPLLQNPPDEHSRYKVPLYICNHGTLPTGYEEELFSGDCRWTYGFYTLLPYMAQGYAMRFVNLFTDSQTALLYTARGVDLLLGLLMARVVLLLAGQWFQDARFRWIFAFLATFLPQGIFVHTYVNTDSCCMLSIALMLYGPEGCFHGPFLPDHGSGHYPLRPVLLQCLRVYSKLYFTLYRIFFICI